MRLLSGDEGARTLDPCLAKAVLSQLSYIPKDVYLFIKVGLSGLEPLASALSAQRSNQAELQAHIDVERALTTQKW